MGIERLTPISLVCCLSLNAASVDPFCDWIVSHLTSKPYDFPSGPDDKHASSRSFTKRNDRCDGEALCPNTKKFVGAYGQLVSFLGLSHLQRLHSCCYGWGL